MIFQHVSNYKFQSPILKIHYFAPAFDQSVVLVAQKAIGVDFLLHINKKSEIVFKYQFRDFVDTLSMPNNKEAVVLRPEEDLIYIFYLQNKTVKKIMHYTFSKISCQNEVHYFCDSNLLCIHENGDNEKLKMTLTYYEWPLKPNYKNQKEQPPSPFVEYIALQQDWNPSFIVRKMNSHSKYAWSKIRHKEFLQIRVHQIIENKSSYKIHKISMHTLASPYQISHLEAAIVQMWEFRPNVLLLFTATNKNQFRAVNASNVVNNTFLWDMNEQYEYNNQNKHEKQHQSKSTKIRQTEFYFPEKYHDLQVDIIGTPQLSMFRTFYFQPEKAVPSPAYFVRNEIEKIVKEEQWTCSHLQKYVVLERNRDTIVEGIYENNNVTNLNIRLISLMKRRELSMFLLKNMKDQPTEEGWDSDLFVDIFKMFDYSQQVE